MKTLWGGLLLLLVVPSLGWALETHTEVGLRGATKADNVAEGYTVGELYWQEALPWETELSPGVTAFLRLDVGLGYMEAASETGGWLALGGDAVLSLMDGAWAFEVGFRPTLLFEDRFGEDDYGGLLQFSSHIGSAITLGRCSIGYRYQHLSNANIYDENQGIDLHMVGAGVHF